MKDVFIIGDNIISPLGNTTAENFSNLLNNTSGVKKHDEKLFSDEPFYASLFNENSYLSTGKFTKFEQLLIASITAVMAGSGINPSDKRTGLILSTTKGNISLLENENDDDGIAERISLNTSARLIAEHFGFANKPLVISNACISGIVAILAGLRFIRSGIYDNVVVSGADVITKFILSGFQSFQAISNDVCKPFDADRDGINLGEAAATVVLSAEDNGNNIKVLGGSVSNDANHISGPSRTGDELSQAIDIALKDTGLTPADIDFISAHGTATIYNDEMEAKAIASSGLDKVPVNSLKGFYGHTLGAAGIVESIVSVESLKQNVILPSKGYKKHGVSKPVNICDTIIHQQVKNCLKTASGFGGCNAAVIFSKQ